MNHHEQFGDKNAKDHGVKLFCVIQHHEKAIAAGCKNMPHCYRDNQFKSKDHCHRELKKSEQNKAEHRRRYAVNGDRHIADTL